MPLLKNHTAVEIARNLRAFLNLEVGLVRGEIPNPARELQRAQSQMKQQNQQLGRLRKQLLEKEQTIDRLRRQQGDADQPGQDDEIQHEFEKRGPWITRFAVGGKEYGGNFNAMQDTRVEQFFESFPNPERILELGSLEGGHSFSLASRPSVKYVLGVEGRDFNVEKARFVQGLLKMTNVEFVTANLETTDLASHGEFDAVFCSGLLYHLPKPWELIERISRVSPNVFMWTHYTKEEDINTSANGWPGFTYQELGLADPLSGMSADSFWPTLEGLQDMLKKYGFEKVHLIEDDPNHPQGPAITLAATAP